MYGNIILYHLADLVNVKRFPRISYYENKTVNGTLICRNCDNAVSKGRRHYCSASCMNTFVRDHLWRFVREDILRRDNYHCSICEKCYRKSKLDVDHIIPVRTGIDPFNKNNLRSLCKECHLAKTNLDNEAQIFKKPKSA